MSGFVVNNQDALKNFKTNDAEPTGLRPNWKEITMQNYELAEECLKANYHGTKRVTEALIPLLHVSSSARIVNVSSSAGKLQNISHGKATEVLSDIDGYSEERMNQLLNEFLKDFKEDSLEIKGWPSYMSAYTISKAAMNAYSRNLAKKFPTFCINCVCPGFVKTDMNLHSGFFTVEEGAESPVRLALLPDGGPSGHFFYRNEVSSF